MRFQANRFADSQCTEPVLSNSDSAALLRRRVLGTDGRVSVYEPGELFTGGQVYEDTDDGPEKVCEPLDPNRDPGDLYRGVEVPPDEFVAYTRVTLRP